jgi:hypothetical protein
MTLEVTSYDDDAVPADIIFVGLSHPLSAADEVLPRTAYNLESGAMALAEEAFELNGATSVVRIIKKLVDMIKEPSMK